MTNTEIIAEAKKQKSYHTNMNREFTAAQEARAKETIATCIYECNQWNGKENENDTYNPFDKLARILGRARM